MLAEDLRGNVSLLQGGHPIVAGDLRCIVAVA